MHWHFRHNKRLFQIHLITFCYLKIENFNLESGLIETLDQLETLDISTTYDEYLINYNFDSVLEQNYDNNYKSKKEEIEEINLPKIKERAINPIVNGKRIK